MINRIELVIAINNNNYRILTYVLGTNGCASKNMNPKPRI